MRDDPNYPVGATQRVLANYKRTTKRAARVALRDKEVEQRRCQIALVVLLLRRRLKLLVLITISKYVLSWSVRKSLGKHRGLDSLCQFDDAHDLAIIICTVLEGAKTLDMFYVVVVPSVNTTAIALGEDAAGETLLDESIAMSKLPTMSLSGPAFRAMMTKLMAEDEDYPVTATKRDMVS